MLGNSPLLVTTKYLAHLWCQYFHMSYHLIFTIILNGNHIHVHFAEEENGGTEKQVSCTRVTQQVNWKSPSHFKSPTLLLHGFILYNSTYNQIIIHSLPFYCDI